MTAALVFRVTGDEEIAAKLLATASVMSEMIDHAADLLAKDVAAEAASVSTRLSAPWSIEGWGGTKRVVAPEFFAHFLAGGTSPHGPSTATRLVFEVDGGMVFAKAVSGIPANPFDDRAVAKTQVGLDALMHGLIESTF